MPWASTLIAALAAWWIIRHWVVRVKPGKLAILENVLKGKQIETGRILARPNEMGVRRDYWKQGWHFQKYPLTTVKDTVDVTHVEELAVIVAKDGAPLPPDRKFADDPAGNAKDPTLDWHNKYQDAGAFYDKGGIRGTQLRILTNGPYHIHPYLFEIKPIMPTRQPPVGTAVPVAL